MRRGLFILLMLSVYVPLQAQTFSIETISDTLSYLVLTTDSTCDRWPLPYPVYQFQTGDIDGDGREDAMVGVVQQRADMAALGLLRSYGGGVPLPAGRAARNGVYLRTYFTP